VFRRTLTIQRSRRTERIVFRGEVLERYRDGRVDAAPVERAQWPRLARALFGVELPSGPFVCDGYAALA
jgi:hypothetical protein